MKSLLSYINESSISRIQQHINDPDPRKRRGIGLITANRSVSADAPEETRNEQNRMNRINNKKLEADLKARELAHIKVEGVYDGNKEHSYLVLGKKGNDNGKLLGHLKDLGSKYGQDSVVHKAYNSDTAQLHGTNETGYPGKDKTEDIGKFHPSKIGQYHSLFRKRPFTITNENSCSSLKFLSIGRGKSFFHRYEEPDTEY